MSVFLPILIAASGTLAVIQFVLWWAECRTTDLESVSLFLDDNYKAANALIQDDTTPDSVVRFIGLTANHVGTPYIARRFARHLLFGRIRRPRPLSPSTLQLKADLAKLSAEAEDHFVTFVGTSMVASAASDPVFSRAYLLAVNAFLSTSGRADDRTVSKDRAETAALDLSDSGLACAA